MTKLERLNSFLTERLMEAVKEIILTVGKTVREYEEETERIRSENERLKEMLRDSGCFLEHTNSGLQFCQPVSSVEPTLIPCHNQEPESFREIQQNRCHSPNEQRPHIKTEEPIYFVDTYKEFAALPSTIENKGQCASDANPADDEMTDFKIKAEHTNLSSNDDMRSTEDAYQSLSPHSPDLRQITSADLHRSQHPNQDTHTGNKAPPTSSWPSSGFPNLGHSILCTNSSYCNSKCCEMQKRTIAKSSPVWKYFSLKDGDCSKAVCRMCKAVISRGRKEYTTSALLKHLRMKHGSALMFKSTE